MACHSMLLSQSFMEFHKHWKTSVSTELLQLLKKIQRVIIPSVYNLFHQNPKTYSNYKTYEFGLVILLRQDEMPWYAPTIINCGVAQTLKNIHFYSAGFQQLLKKTPRVIVTGTQHVSPKSKDIFKLRNSL